MPLDNHSLFIITSLWYKQKSIHGVLEGKKIGFCTLNIISSYPFVSWNSTSARNPEHRPSTTPSCLLQTAKDLCTRNNAIQLFPDTLEQHQWISEVVLWAFSKAFSRAIHLARAYHPLTSPVACNLTPLPIPLLSIIMRSSSLVAGVHPCCCLPSFTLTLTSSPSLLVAPCPPLPSSFCSLSIALANAFSCPSPCCGMLRHIPFFTTCCTRMV